MKNELLAPNGKPSNLNAEQYKLVRTPAFKKWFGDWENDPANASKVVDENGEPRICYHGTFRKFNVFKEEFPNDKSVRVGHWFTTNKELANEYGKSKLYFINAKKITFDSNNRDDYDDLGFDAYIYNYNWSDKYNTNINFNINVYNSNQIKLADGKNTTFDSRNNDIRFEQGGATESFTPDYLRMFIGK